MVKIFSSPSAANVTPSTESVKCVPGCAAGMRSLPPTWLAHLEVTRGTMPRFAGNEQDRAALGRYLASLNPALTPPPQAQ